MSVMKHVHNVRKRMPEIAAVFEPMEDIVSLLKANGIPIDLPPIGEHPALDFLEQAKMLWDNTVCVCVCVCVCCGTTRYAMML
jgi:hypothetical protein